MTGAGIVAIGGMMIRPRWVLPPSDLAAPAFSFRVSANRLKLIFSTQSRIFQILSSTHTLVKSSETLRPASAAAVSR